MIEVILLLAAHACTGGSASTADDKRAFDVQAGLIATPKQLSSSMFTDVSRALGLEDESDDSKYLLVSIQMFGLANRLRLLAAAVQEAEDSGRRLIVDWRPAPGCAASFHDLFDDTALMKWAEGTVFHGAHEVLDALLALVSWSSPVVQVGFQDTATSVLVWRPRGNVLDSKSLLATAGKLVVMKQGSMFIRSGKSCQEHFHRKQRLYSSLLRHVTPVIATWRDQVLGSLQVDRRLIVGVHVRVHDPRHDWAVVAPQARTLANEVGDGSVHDAEVFDDVAPLALFESAIVAMVAQIPRVHFFVASNSEAVKLRLVEVLGEDRVSSVNNSLEGSRDSAVGMQRSLLDFAVLGAGSLLLHSFGSSFGEEAAAASLIPSVRIRQGGHVLGTDLSRQYCGNAGVENGQLAMLELSGAGGQQQPTFGHSERAKECYRDPSLEKERGHICAAVATRSPCTYFERAWGIPGVFC